MYEQIYNLTSMFFKSLKGNLMYEFLISKFIKQIVTLISYKTFIAGKGLGGTLFSCVTKIYCDCHLVLLIYRFFFNLDAIKCKIVANRMIIEI